jgi:hypothetical protein
MDFQSKAGSTNIGGAFAAAQIAGFNDQVVKFSGTTTLIATFNQVTKGFQLSQLKCDVNRSISKYTWAITTAPSEGVGLGRHIEAFRTLQEKTLILTEAEVEMTP